MAKLCTTKAEAAAFAAEVEAKLAKSGPFLGGQTPGPEDAKAFDKLLGAKSVEIARWAKHMSSFSKKERADWGETKGQTKAERKAAFAAGDGQNVTVVKKEKKAEKAHKDCLDNMDDHPSFPKREEAVLARWQEINAFETSLKLSEGRPVFQFYDGPPFATGLPHYGHILAGTIKDIVCRWAHQTGHYVERRFGWDCHGLPIEFEIEKELGIKTSHDVMKIGIKKYNEHCRAIVMRYAAEWEKTVTRMGRWIDFKNDYKTMNLSYMESVWWVFSQLYEKGLVYRGYKVMPYSIGCTTVLSNFEANMNYKNVSDPSVVVTLPWVSEPDVAFLAWTTTPWTLPSNLALCVNPTMVYYQIKVKETGKKFVLAKDRLVQIFPKLAKQKGKDLPYELIKEYKGQDLKDVEYTPLFNYYLNKKEQGAFRVLVDAYVTSDSGTGVVHQAPAFGEDDYRVCLAANIITKDEEVPCPVDGNGQFTDVVSEWKGTMVKDADKDIQKHLKDAGRLYMAGAIKHDYPFCWRSESPLIYKTIASWFVNVTEVKDKLLANNKKTYWVPENVQTGRFNNWLEQARDWAVSRNRYWGTPLPLWVSEDYTQVKCVGSVAELEKLTGKTITDIHRDSIDDLTIPDPRGAEYPPLKRVPEVFDCWFESGSMPYAQQHYPFENKEKFENGFPADFIAEGIDQTRGWFYTLLVLSSAIFDKPPFKNLIVNGLVLAEDGQKMSKRKQNYPPPTDVIDKYGADAVRLYLINSPVVRGMDLKFKEVDVKAVVRDVLLPMYSALNFFTINYNRMVISEEKFTTECSMENVMDRWINAECEKLITDVSAEMKAYHLYTVVPVVLKWVENLTNTYVRMNRPRMKGQKGLQDQKDSLATLFRILMVTAKVMAPFTPYMAEQIFQQLKPLAPKEEQVDSVHYLMVPTAAASFDEEVIRKVERLQKVCVMVRTARDRKGVGVRKPVKEVIVVNNEQQYVDDIAGLEEYVKDEVNTFELMLKTDGSQWVLTKAEPNSASLGKKYKKDASAIKKAIMADQLKIAEAVMNDGKVTVAGFELTEDDICLVREFKAGVTGYETIGDGKTLVLVNLEQDEETITVGAAREVVSKVQQLRKRAGLEMTDKVKVFYATTNETFEAVFAKKTEMVAELLRSEVQPVSAKTDKDVLVAEQELEDIGLTLTLCKA